MCINKLSSLYFILMKCNIFLFYRANENESIIQLMMDCLPEERLKRNVVRGRLDVLGKPCFIF